MAGHLKAKLIVLFALFLQMASAQTILPGPARPMITTPISAANLVRLAGNTRPEANADNDRGIVADNLPMEHMLFQLKRPPEQEQALNLLIDQMHDPASPNFHKWLTPLQFGTQYGPSQADVQKITSWLGAQGFTVNVVYPSGMAIDFSGTAGQVRRAFHTEIHNVIARGNLHIANMSDPLIPAALTPAVAGIVSLHNIPARPMFVKKPEYTFGGCGRDCYPVTPPDLATIYNFNPVFVSGNTGQDQTIYLIEDSNLYSTSDWTTFRSTFGLSGYTSASLSTIHPLPSSGTNNCTNPGITSDDVEAILDAEYASAAAPSAAIVMATCSTATTDGGLVAIQNLINASSPPAIISYSYGECETGNGATSNAAYKAIYQQGVAEGTSIFVAAMDNAAASCDYGNNVLYATSGVGVNGLGSTIYNVAVGGTDFGDTFAGTNSFYWNTSNRASYGSALSYIPEIPWNDSCASELMASANTGSAVTYGVSGFCNTSLARTGLFLNDMGGGGGPSACATGSPSPLNSEVVSGTCAGWPKPSWQTNVAGIPNDGVRDLPDVSLFASDGTFWKHFYVICFSDTSNQGVPCSGSPSTWYGAGGTSFASPIMAGVQALVNESTGAPQGNPNYRLYQIAASTYGTTGNDCNSNNGATSNSMCVFHDVTLGDNDVPCRKTYDCYLPSGTYGVLSTSDSTYNPAYATAQGWDFATGLGSLNVANLVNNWTNLQPHWTVVGTGDFRGTGAGDLLWRNVDGNVEIWLMNGDTVAAGVGGQIVSNDWTIVGTGDFNGDGKSDILWRNTNTGMIQIWEMNGGTIIAGVGFQTVTTDWQIAGAGDFNGDGYADILWRNTQSGEVLIWEMNGGTVIAEVGGQVVSNDWTIAGIGDFNGNGMSDILWRNIDGTVVIWLMNGGTVVTDVGGQAVTNDWRIAGIGDFNGNGMSDILWRNVDGELLIWEMNGGSVIAEVGGQVVTNDWSIASVGSVRASGLGEIVWRDTNGSIAVWLMSGGSVSEGANLGAVP